MKKSYTKPEVLSIKLSALESISASFESFKNFAGIAQDVGITSYEFMSKTN